MQQRSLRTLQFFINQEKPKGGDWQTRANKLYAESGSMHKFGNAFDATMLDTPLQKVHDYIAANPNEFPFIHFIECDITWLHVGRATSLISPSGHRHGTVKVVKQQPIDWSKLVKI
ncbi:hypothetical protein N5V81_13345 [Escherichia coli]|nr:hypothetical protein [Escherichia coli]